MISNPGIYLNLFSDMMDRKYSLMETGMLSFVNQLKLRASYGELGNDRVGQWQYIQSFSFGNNYVFGTNDVPGIFANTMPNPNITWEVSKKTDIGLEGT